MKLTCAWWKAPTGSLSRRREAGAQTITLESYEEILTVPLSGEAIRTMNYVDDISVTLRRILSVLPILTEDDRKRVAEHIRQADPSYDSVVKALNE